MKKQILSVLLILVMIAVPFCASAEGTNAGQGPAAGPLRENARKLADEYAKRLNVKDQPFVDQEDIGPVLQILDQLKLFADQKIEFSSAELEYLVMQLNAKCAYGISDWDEYKNIINFGNSQTV